MAVCEHCGHEYLDSYEECPFCARRKAEIEEILSTPAPIKRFHVSPRVIGVASAIGTMTAVIVYFGLALILGTTTLPGTRAAVQQQACFATQQQVERQAALYESENGVARLSNVRLLVGDYLESMPVCPAKGRYIWNADKGWLVCTVHGWHGAASR